MRKILVLVLISIGVPQLFAQNTVDLIEHAQRFRQLVASEQWEEARSMMSDDPRRWFESREGSGSVWTVGPEGGPWSGWDDEFGSTSTVIEWSAGESSATVRVYEINDYFRLLERGAVTNENTYFFNSEGLIDGLLIRAAGERPPGRTREFLRWALENDPRELRELMPNGNIDPSGDHPRRFRILLERWREASGLPALGPSAGDTADEAVRSSPESPLRRLAERFVQGWLDDDEDGVMATLAPGAVLLPHNGVEPVVGEESIRAFWFPGDGPAARVTAFEQTYDEVDESDEVGYARGRFTLEFELDGTRHRSVGNYLMLFRRNLAGEWKITHRIWNDRRE